MSERGGLSCGCVSKEYSEYTQHVHVVLELQTKLSILPDHHHQSRNAPRTDNLSPWSIRQNLPKVQSPPSLTGATSTVRG